MSRFLVKNGDIYSLRRRVPAPLQRPLGIREIYRSLSTSSRRIANARAARLFILTEEIFRMAAKQAKQEAPPVSDEEMQAAAKSWLDRMAGGYREAIDDMTPGELSFEPRSIAPNMLRWTEEMLRINDCHNWTTRDKELEEAQTALHLAGFEREFRREQLDRMHGLMLSALDGYVRRRWSEQTGAPAPAVRVPVPLPPSPSFPELIEAFVEEKGRVVDGSRPYDEHTVSQSRATFQLFIEIIGERPVREYAIRSPTISASYRRRIFGLSREQGISELDEGRENATIAHQCGR